MLPERKLDFDEFTYIVFVDNLGSEKFQAGDPVMALHLSHTAKGEFVGLVNELSLFREGRNTNVKIERTLAHCGLLTQVDVFNFNETQCREIILVLLNIMKPL
jgi:hypothetical protein